MKRTITSLLAVCFLSFSLNIQAQLDNRQRTPQTIVSDGLTELPAANPKVYNRVIGEMAETGTTGINILVGMLQPGGGPANNAKVEYAIDGVVSYVSAPGKEAQRKVVHDALIAALQKISDPLNREFILGQINKIATAEDFKFYENLLGDKNLAAFAARGLATMPGADAKIAGLINNTKTPDATLAYLAYFRKLKNVEPTLLTWVTNGDKTVRAAALNALTVCGSETALTSVKASGDTDSYIQLLNNLGDSKTVAKEAKGLLKSKESALRCAGLRLLLKAEPAQASKNILKALRDRDAAYRHTALLNAIPVAGEGIVPQVAAQFNKLSINTKAEVLDWLGDNKADTQLDLVIAAMNSKDSIVAKAAIANASIIGGDKALEALLPLLADSKKGKLASAALLSFNGDITKGVLKSLQSTDAATQKQALNLAATRRISAAYPAVVKLTRSADKEVSAAAFAAIGGVAKTENFDEICTMLDASTGSATSQLQSAAAATIASLPAAERFAKTNKRMSASAKPALYYPLLAGTGTAEAVAKLVEGLNGKERAAALDALLKVNNPAAYTNLFRVATTAKGDERDKLLNKVVTLAGRASLSPAAAYDLYSRVLELKPDAKVRKQVMSALNKCNNLPALMLAAEYLTDSDVAYAAANTVSTIAEKNASLQKGSAVRDALNKAVAVFKQKQAGGDADAGYAVDRVNLMTAKWNNEGGFKAVSATQSADVVLGSNLENFDTYFDWKATGDAIITLRSMPLVRLSVSDGVSVEGSKTVAPVRKNEWNSIHVKMNNDRLFVNVNGVDVAVNFTVNTIPGTDQKAPYSGKVSINSKNNVELRRVFQEELPSVPIYELSAEEKAQGFEVLFDGRSLENFHGNTAAYVPVDGAIYVSAQYGGQGNLYTKKNYSDFIFRFEFYFDVPGVNNGIGIRTGKDVTGVDAAYNGMEIQVLDHDDPIYQGHPFGYKGLRPYQNHGSIYGVVPSKHVEFGPIRQWHTEEIKAVGDRITVTVDGVVITDANIREACQGHAVAPDGGNRNPYTVDHNNHPGLFNKEGYISFCGHGAGVKFRNIRVLDLSKNQSNNQIKKKSKRK